MALKTLNSDCLPGFLIRYPFCTREIEPGIRVSYPLESSWLILRATVRFRPPSASLLVFCSSSWRGLCVSSIFAFPFVWMGQPPHLGRTSRTGPLAPPRSCVALQRGTTSSQLPSRWALVWRLAQAHCVVSWQVSHRSSTTCRLRIEYGVSCVLDRCVLARQ